MTLSSALTEELIRQTECYLKELAEFRATLPDRGSKGSPQNWERGIAMIQKERELERKYPLTRLWPSILGRGFGIDA